MAFKMKKGSPIERNFGISPMKEGKTKLLDKVKAGAKAFVAGAKQSHRGFDKAVTTYMDEKKKYREGYKKTK